MKHLIIGLILLAFLLSSCGPGCSSAQYIELTQLLLEEWDDQVALTNSTSRVALPAQISELQSIAREFKRLELQECYHPTRDRMVKYMDEIIEGFIAFMSQEEDSVVSNHFKNADQYFESAIREMNKIDE